MLVILMMCVMVFVVMLALGLSLSGRFLLVDVVVGGCGVGGGRGDSIAWVEEFGVVAVMVIAGRNKGEMVILVVEVDVDAIVSLCVSVLLYMFVYELVLKMCLLVCCVGL